MKGKCVGTCSQCEGPVIETRSDEGKRHQQCKVCGGVRTEELPVVIPIDWNRNAQRS